MKFKFSVHVPLGIVLFVCVAASISARGPFLNDDYEKIRLNASFLNERPLWHKLFQPEAGFEISYFRPVNNFLMACAARAFGTDDAAPYRALSALIFGLSALAIYGAAKRLYGSSRMALFSAALYALHPFNSWFYFQACWIGMPLAILCAIGAWRIYEIAVERPESEDLAWGLALFVLVYAAGLCKDGGSLVAFVLLPIAIWNRSSTRSRRLRLWCLAALGFVIFMFHRANVLSPDPRVTAQSISHALSHSGSLALQYFAALASGTNFNFARALHAGPGWPLTLGLAAGFAALLWKARHRPVIAVLLWALFLSCLESVAASFISFEIVSTRAVLILAVLALLLPALAHETKYRKSAAFAACLFLAFFSFQSARHLWASLDTERFYDYHNRPPYSWKLLATYGRLAGEEGRWPEAEAAFRESLRFSARPSSYVNLGHALSALAKSENDARRSEEAIRAFGDALKITPRSENTHAAAAGAVLQYKSLGGGESKAAALLPASAEVYYGIGGALAHSGHAEEAAFFFREAMLLDPRSADARAALAEQLSILGEFKEAEPELHEALRLDPNHAEANYQLGLLCFKQSRWEEAVRYFQKAQKLRPDSPPELKHFLKSARTVLRNTNPLP